MDSCRTRTSREIWEPLVHMNFWGDSYGPMAPLLCFQENPYRPMALKVPQTFPPTRKSTLWTNAGQDRNFQRTLGAIGPYLFLGKFIWTNHWSIPFPGEIRMDQWS